MEIFEKEVASALMQKAIESGAIKLLGSTGSGSEEVAERMAKRDAKYLRTLFTALTQDTHSPE